MSEAKVTVHRPKPIKCCSNITRAHSSTFLFSVPANFIESTESYARSRLNFQNLPTSSSTTAKSQDQSNNLKALAQIEQELLNLTLRTSKPRTQNIEVPFRPSNPMVNDEYWSEDCSFSTEEEQEADVEALPRLRRVQSA
eukprot:TRINITY_DN58_c0_g1_i3.p1 TRINITY_DN58_c0_g1~~TRINITY_DN58_c0_g1_i3.p1  ORF type:complete len:140 (+),score=20.38 TRINITY_DN58_c0_g1_i3:153-572(+)